jgi:hypothetical protein
LLLTIGASVLQTIDLPIVSVGGIGADGKFRYWKDFFDLTPLARVNLEPDGAGVKKI